MPVRGLNRLHRGVKGKLQKEPGILVASWNAWQEATETAALAGVPVGPLTCWASNAPYSVHEAKEAGDRAQERAQLLSGFRRWLLHDDEPKAGYFSRTAQLHRRSFLQEAAAWRDQALQFAQEVFALRDALERVAARYFEGSHLLFAEEHQALETQAKVWRLRLEHFNHVVVVEFDGWVKTGHVFPGWNLP